MSTREVLTDERAAVFLKICLRDGSFQPIKNIDTSCAALSPKNYICTETTAAVSARRKILQGETAALSAGRKIGEPATVPPMEKNVVAETAAVAIASALSQGQNAQFLSDVVLDKPAWLHSDFHSPSPNISFPSLFSIWHGEIYLPYGIIDVLFVVLKLFS